MGTPTTPASSVDAPRRTAPFILVAVAALIALALVVGALLARRPTEFPDDSPEAAAQAYLQALFDDDEQAARRYLAPELIDTCNPVALSYRFRAADTVRFVGITTGGRRAEIDLEFSYANDYEPFEIPIDDRWRTPHSAGIELEQRDQGWVIVGATWIPKSLSRKVMPCTA